MDKTISKRDLPSVCQWFAYCDHDAIGTVVHPILGDVPICERCASRFDMLDDVRREN